MVEDCPGSPPRDHHDRGVDVATDQVGHSRCVDNAQPLDAQDAQIPVDNCQIIAGNTHPAGPGRVVNGARPRSQIGLERLR